MIDELEVVRRLGAEERAPDRAARERVRARVFAGAADAAPPRRRRRPSLTILAPAAAVTLAVALLLVLRPASDEREFAGERPPSAGGVPSLFPAPSQFLYVRSRGRGDLRRTNVREVWVSERGRGRIVEREGPETRTTRLGPVRLRIGNRTFTHGELARYAPTGPELLDALRRAPARGPADVPDDPFRQLGDVLRTASAPPRVRRAAVDALPLVPGAEALGPRTDSAGRRGAGFARVIEGQREEIVVDPRTLTMLEETFSVADRAVRRRGAPDVLGRTTYLERAVVARAGQRP